MSVSCLLREYLGGIWPLFSYPIIHAFWFKNSNVLNNNYSHIDLVIHNRNGYGFVSCCRMFQYIRNTNHMHDHNHKSKYDLTILF